MRARVAAVALLCSAGVAVLLWIARERLSALAGGGGASPRGSEPAARSEPEATRAIAPRPTRDPSAAAAGPPIAATELEGLTELAPDSLEPTAVREILAAAIAEQLPDRKLSSDQLDALADATLRLRRAQQALRDLPRTPENASALAALRDDVGRAVSDFEYVLDLDPAAFTALLAAPDGIDVDPPGIGGTHR